MHGVTRYPSSGSSIRKVLLLINFLIYFKVSGNIVTSAKLLGSGMKCETYEPDSPKLGNKFFSSLKSSPKDFM